MEAVNFKNFILQSWFKRFTWTRNNTILLFKEAQCKKILDFRLTSGNHFKDTFKPILYQFQCIVASTDVYRRKLTGHENQQYGRMFIEDKMILKEDLTEDIVASYLENQIETLEKLFSQYDEKDIVSSTNKIFVLPDHEYLHQGEIILMFRSAGVDLPESYKKTWGL